MQILYIKNDTAPVDALLGWVPAPKKGKGKTLKKGTYPK